MRCRFVDDLDLLAITVWGEARGESPAGRLAVAYVWINRWVKAGKKGSISRIVLAPWQASFWNTEDPTRPSIGEIAPEDPIWIECYAAACAAYFGLATDPSFGATHYLNEEVTRAGRPNHDLPSWFDESKVRARIGRHTFLKVA